MEAEAINAITVNAKRTLVLLGTSLGFRVYDFESMELRAQRCLGGGVGPLDVLETSNILALGGGGPLPYTAPSKVVLWDDHEQAVRAEIVFRSEVRGLKIKYEYLFVALESRLYVYSLFEQLELKGEYPTFAGPEGMLATNAADTPTCFAFVKPDVPSEAPSDAQKGGCVQIINLEESRQVSVFAHSSAVKRMAFNFKGNLFATASEKGTLIRVFEAAKGIKLREFRRGLENARIHSLDFDFFEQAVGCVSEPGSLHIWSLEWA